MNVIAKIQAVAEERFKEADLEDCFLLDILISGSKVEVYIDSDPGVKFWQCQKLSRAIEAYLDETEDLGDAYLLEVSSPGVDKPLKLYRQFPRNIGRDLDLTLTEDRKVTGRLEELTEKELTLRVPGAKKGMFKKLVVPFSEVVAAIVQVSFKKKK